MVGIQGVGGVPEPKPERPANIRDKAAPETAKGGESKDDVVISNAAQAAANLAQVVSKLEVTPDVRADRVEAARQAIERGDYKNPDIVKTVAERISKFL